MLKNKRTKAKILEDRSKAVVGSLIWVIVGLMIALGGFVWSTYTDRSPEITGANVGASMMGVVGLLIASSAILILSAVVISTQVKSRKRRKK